MEFNTELLNKISYSIVSPFDLFSSNEAERNLTPASAGKLVSDALRNTNNETALICIFNAASYDQLSVYLAQVSGVLKIEKVNMVKNACDYMADYETKKRLSVPVIASSTFKTIPIESLNISNASSHDVVSENEVDQELVVDAAAELTALEAFKTNLSEEMQANIASVETLLTIPSNKLLVAGSPDSMAEQINSHCEGLPQNTPFTLALCFAGSVAAVNYINTMVIG